ncbi:MAG TPA: M48 family metalloprotease [Candidatus Udaeobacter sp.]|jgi:predicted Zn-dependent protease|nr:M48 family metalloprotease [Candidatus Udaeobacter sp.]
MRPTRSVALVLAALALSLNACATNPVTGRRELSLVSESQELQIGRDGYSAVISEYGRYDDPALSAYVDTVGQRVARTSDLPNLEWHFTVVDDPAVNAFAMPGGYIYITRGILPYLNSEAQLAAVLGHEIGHVTHRHTAEQITRQQLAGLGLGVLQVAVPGLRPYSSAGQQALGLLFLSFSRQNENEADALGVTYSTRASYDAREMPATYTTLQRIQVSSGSSIPTFLSTHPDPGDRQGRTTELARQATAGKTGLIIRQRDYLRHLDGLVFGPDPRQGYFEGRTFYHPQQNFQLDVPAGWKQQNSHASVAAAEPSNKALVQLSVADAGESSPEAYVQALRSAGKITDMTGRRENIGGYDAWLGRVIAPGTNGPVTLDAAFIRTPGTMYQMLGESTQPGDANDQQVIETMRSFRPLADPSRRRATPARVRLSQAPSSGSLRAMLPQLGDQGATPDQLSILNGLDLDETVQSGKTLKLVTPGRNR